MEKAISPILSASASAKISHDFAPPKTTSLFSCTHVNWICGVSLEVEIGTGTIPCKPESEQSLMKAESYLSADSALHALSKRCEEAIHSRH